MKKVYVIDDDSDIVNSVTMVLEANGYEVASQLTEDNAPENIEAFGPDMVILDVMFPENDSAGFEIARAIRHHEPIKDVPIMMFSAVNKAGSFAGTFSDKDKDDMYMPVNKFVDKPINMKKLLEAVAELIDE